MRILHVHHFLDMGGSETVVLQLAREQKRLGHDVTICCMFGEGPQDARAAEYGIPVVYLHSANKPIAKIRALWSYLGKERFDVLHSHWAVWLATAVAGFLRSTPRVHTNHSNQPRRLFVEHRIACFFTDKVVCLTPYIEPYIVKWVAVPRRKIEIIPNGIEFTALKQASRAEIDDVPAEAPVVGMVARLSPPKDYDTYLRAIQIVETHRADIHFLSIGNGQQREHFEQQAKTMGLQHLHFLGGRKDVPALLRRMTVSVLATRHEGLPVSLVEAMVSGVACIGSDIPANRFTLDEGKAGILVPGADAQALANAIEELIDNPDRCRQLTTSAEAYAQRFNVSTMTESYLALYTRLLPKNAR